MIRTNLATRPFYNERLVNLWLLLLAAVVTAATVFNVTHVRSDSGSNTGLASQAAQNVARTNEARRDDFSEQVRAEHKAIYDAIAAQDPDAARQWMLVHELMSSEEPRFFAIGDQNDELVFQPRARSNRPRRFEHRGDCGPVVPRAGGQRR